MTVYLITNSAKTDITNIVGTVSISGEYRSPSRTLDVSILKSQYDKNSFVASINLGDRIEVKFQNEVIFFGVITSRRKATNSEEINYIVKDYGIYLLRNKTSYNFKNMTPEEITAKVCRDFGINVGTLYKTGKKISRVFMGATLYDIIMSSYNLALKGKYMCLFTGMNLNIILKGNEQALDIKADTNLIDCNVLENIDNLVNRVHVFNSDDTLVKTFENNSDVKSYGLMTGYYKLSKDESFDKAKDVLTRKTSKITVSNFGDISYTSGKNVYFHEPYNGIKSVLYIESDEHLFKDGIYTNKLTLSYDNNSDEQEGGRDG